MKKKYDPIELHKCPVCKQKFIPAPEHRYKGYGDRLICSWACLCKYRESKRNYRSLKS